MSKNTDMSAFTDGRVPDETESDDESRRKTRNTIAFGMDMENFKRSDVGRYLDACARRDIAEHLSELATVDASDTNAIRLLQQEIAARRMWSDWISEAIQAGQAAQETALERNTL